MSRTFTKNVSNSLGLGTGTYGSLVNGAAIISVHAWVKIASTTTAAFDNRILSTSINGTGNGLLLTIDNTTANRLVRIDARSVTADTLRTASSTTNLGLSVWHSVGGVINIAGDFITPYANGSAEGGAAVVFTNAVYTNGTPGAQDRIGAHNSAITTASQFAGEIGHVAIWTGDIGANGFTALWRGQQAGRVRDANGNGPVFWMPIWGLDSPERCLVSGTAGTITGSLPFASEPPLQPFTRQERASMPDIEAAFLPAWAQGANQLIGGGVMGG